MDFNSVSALLTWTLTLVERFNYFTENREVLRSNYTHTYTEVIAVFLHIKRTIYILEGNIFSIEHAYNTT